MTKVILYVEIDKKLKKRILKKILELDDYNIKRATVEAFNLWLRSKK